MSFDRPSKPVTAPSNWVARFAPLVAAGAPVLDVACGDGRHVRFFLERGHRVSAVDQDISGLADLQGDDRVEIVEADIEDGQPWPFPGRTFGAVVVTNYMHRPLFQVLADSLAPGGVLLFETFGQGNERLGRPRNPDFLLQPGELLRAYQDRLQIVAYEHGEEREPRPAIRQRIVAVNAEHTVLLP